MILAIALPRNCAALGLSLRDIFTATRAPLLAGAALYAVVWSLRLALIDFEEAVRLPFMVCAGGATYLFGVQIFDRGIWTDTRRLIAALRG